MIETTKAPPLAAASEPCYIASEFSPLEVAVLHRPGDEIDRLTPANKGRFLFEDIPFLRTMQEEHDAFAKILRNQGIRILYLKDLLSDVLEDGRLLVQLAGRAFEQEGQRAALHEVLKHCTKDQIVEMLFAGVTASELQDYTGARLGSTSSREDPFILEPVPNAYFTRDPAVVIGNGVVFCKAHFQQRARETLILRTVFEHHPLFSPCQSIYGGSRAKDEERPFTIEGGDIIVLNEHAVMVGCSQRTRSESIQKLAARLFSSGRALRVYEVAIPVQREYMHLDTVFTVVGSAVVVAYPDVIERVVEIRRYEPIPVHGEILAYPYADTRRFQEILESELGESITVVHTGNNEARYAAREQGADGTNMLAVSPKRVVSYDRNTHTNEAMSRAGIDVLEIHGSELVRGLGGPRCMTMPIRRAPGKQATPRPKE